MSTKDNLADGEMKNVVSNIYEAHTPVYLAPRSFVERNSRADNDRERDGQVTRAVTQVGC